MQAIVARRGGATRFAGPAMPLAGQAGLVMTAARAHPPTAAAYGGGGYGAMAAGGGSGGATERFSSPDGEGGSGPGSLRVTGGTGAGGAGADAAWNWSLPVPDGPSPCGGGITGGGITGKGVRPPAAAAVVPAGVVVAPPGASGVAAADAEAPLRPLPVPAGLGVFGWNDCGPAAWAGALLAGLPEAGGNVGVPGKPTAAVGPPGRVADG